MNPPIDPRRIELLDPEVVAMLKTKTPAQKLEIAFALHRFARGMLFSRIQSHHPDWSEAEIYAAVVKRMSREEP